jgi:hypothetical protein
MSLFSKPGNDTLAHRIAAGDNRRMLHRQRRRQAGAGLFYFENEPGRRSSAKLFTRDEAFLIAVNIAKLRRQILKDIPRPPNAASRDD